MFLVDKLPDDLRESAYYAAEEAAWSWPDAIRVIAHLSKLHQAVCGIEVWLPTEPGPTIPEPYIYVWAGEERSPEETWDQYVERVNRQAVTYISGFRWDERDIEHQGLSAYFNLEVCCL
jgi:hypothetical protein